MESIFFEKQEGALCAQHALNALLQGAYFTAVDLAGIARTLDAEEREVLSHGGTDTPEYLRAFQQDSFNMDDTGYFSVQVIGSALRVWNLRLVPFNATEDPIAGAARIDPTSPTAYICNFREHWFTIRKFASQQWFNLNSLLNGPELISPTYLHLFLSQLQTEGYSIFVVDGDLPQCQADVDLLLLPPLGSASASSSVGDDQDPELNAAIALSLGGKHVAARSPTTPDEDTAAALKASANELDDGDISLKEAIARSMAFEGEEDFQKALLLSMQNGAESQPTTSLNANCPGPSTPAAQNSKLPSAVLGASSNPADLRAKRAAFLDRLQNSGQKDKNTEDDE